MKVLSWLGGACVLAGLLASPPAFAQWKGAPKKGASEPPKEDTPEAKAAPYVKAGAEAAKAKEWDDAYAEYAIAWSIVQSWEVALGLGRAAYETQHYAEAIRRFEYYLREVPEKKATKKQKTEAEGLLKDARSKTGLLVITGPAGGDVLLDGEEVGKTPITDGIPVDPGKHKVEVRQGSKGETKTTEITAGARVELDFTPPKAPPPKTVVVKEEGVFTPQIRTAAVIGGGALALSGIVAGGVMLGVSFAKIDEKRAAEADLFGGEAKAQDAAQAAYEAQNAALWCLVGGGIAGLGTGAFYFFTRPRVKAPVDVGAFVGPSGPSVWMSGKF